MYANGQTNTLMLKNCFHVPSDIGNLVSIGQFIGAGSQIQMTQESMELHAPDNRLLCIAPLQGTQFILNMHAANQSNANATAGGDSAPESHTWLEWHHALSHASIQALQTMHQQNLVDGMKIIPSPQNFVCKGCIQGKHTSKPLPHESKNKYKEIGDLVVTNLWGPAPIEGKGGLNYYISFTNAAT